MSDDSENEWDFESASEGDEEEKEDRAANAVPKHGDRGIAAGENKRPPIEPSKLKTGKDERQTDAQQKTVKQDPIPKDTRQIDVPKTAVPDTSGPSDHAHAQLRQSSEESTGEDDTNTDDVIFKGEHDSAVATLESSKLNHELELDSSNTAVVPQVPCQGNDDFETEDGWGNDWEGASVEQMGQTVAHDSRTVSAQIPDEDIPSSKRTEEKKLPSDGKEVEEQSTKVKETRTTMESEPQPAFSGEAQPAQVSSLFDRLTDDKSNASSGGGGWSSAFGFMSSNLTNVVESFIGVPSPEQFIEDERELEKKAAEQAKTEKSESKRDDGPDPSSAKVEADSWDWGDVIENTARGVIGHSLDVLEDIGKRTFDAVTVSSDDGRRRRMRLAETIKQGPDATLSGLLREAKTTATQDTGSSRTASESYTEEPNLFALSFDKYNGVVNLEALTLLSENCVKLLRSRSDQATFELPPADEFSSTGSQASGSVSDLADAIRNCVSNMVETGCESAITTFIDEHGSIMQRIEDMRSNGDGAEIDSVEMHAVAVDCLAHLTSSSLHILHKVANLSLASSNVRVSPSEVMRLRTLLLTRVNYCTEMIAVGLQDDLLSDLCLEAANSESYIGEAFTQLVPVFKLALTQAKDSKPATAPRQQQPRQSRPKKGKLGAVKVAKAD